jgi:hypothetical protein
VFEEILSVYSENYMKPVNAVHRKKTQLLNVKVTGIYSYRGVLKGWSRQVSPAVGAS